MCKRALDEATNPSIMLHRSDTPKHILARRERSRRARARARDGLAVFALEANHDAVVLALIESAKLSEQDALDRRKVNAALAKMLGEWAAHWRTGLR
jgi:hypothetical protein